MNKVLKNVSLLLLILIPIILSIFVRIQPLSLPMMEDNARNQINGIIKNNIASQILQQYPNLPQQTLIEEVDAQFVTVVKEQEVAIENEVKYRAELYRQMYTYDDGHPYLSDIDTYYWYYLAEYYNNTGHTGIEINGKIIDPLERNYGLEVNEQFPPIFEAWVYKAVHIFNKDYTILNAAYITSIIICALAIIPIFLIGRRIAGEIGGFVAALIAAVHPALVSRTVAGVADSDPWHFLLPALIVWFFIEGMLATDWKKYLWFGGAGMVLGLHQWIWGGWAYTMIFIMAASFALVAVSFLSKRDWKKPRVDLSLFMTAGLIFTTIISMLIRKSAWFGISRFSDGIFMPITFATRKDVAVASIWPNVLTTVAELNPANTPVVIQAIGIGLLIAAGIGLVALLFKFWEKKEDVYLFSAVLLLTWCFATFYASLSSIRFTAVMVMAVALLTGALFGIGAENLKRWIKKDWIIYVIFIVVIICSFSYLVRDGYNLARSSGPMMNDDWYNTLIAIKTDSTIDSAVLTSWWDFGHWFKAISERPVMSDGGDQGKRIYWVGKAFLVEETESVNILRMMTCDKELDVNGPPEKYEKAYGTIDAIGMLSQIHKINNNHSSVYCSDPKTNYVIVSDDMVGKAPVWAHFGGWNFTKAEMYNKVKGTKTGTGTAILSEYGLEDPTKTYFDIQATPADQWISPWPQYVSGGWRGCNVNNETYVCPIGLTLGGNGQQTQVLNSVIISGNSTLFDILLLNNQGISLGGSKLEPSRVATVEESGLVFETLKGELPLDVLFDKENKRILVMDPALTNSTFTNLYFLEGRYNKQFEKFYQKPGIIVYKVKW